MEHKERMAITNEIAKKIVAKHKRNIVAIALFGSTARGEDKKYSDIEITVYTKGKIKLQTKDYLFKDIMVAIDVLDLKDVEKRIARIDFLWSLEVSRYVNNKVIYGNENIIKNIEKKIFNHTFKKSKEAIEYNLPSFVDNLNKVRNTQNINDLLMFSKELLYFINLSLGLINKKYFTRNYYRNFVEAYEFPKLPRDYKNLVEEILLCTDIEKLKLLLLRHGRNFIDFLEKEGIKIKIYSDLSFID